MEIVNNNNWAQRTYRDDAARTMNCEQIVPGNDKLKKIAPGNHDQEKKKGTNIHCLMLNCAMHMYNWFLQNNSFFSELLIIPPFFLF